MQKLKFPMEYLRVTQGYGFKADGSVDTNSYSHAGTYAMDFGGKDAGSDKLYCPCDMVVKRCRQNANGELYLETVEPVLFADGTTDYAHLLFLHDSAFNVSEGQILPLGYHFYDEGGMGGGNPGKFGTHVHIEGGKGKWKSTTQSLNAQGVYASENMFPLHKLFIVGDDVEILNDGGYKWVRESEVDAQKEPVIKDDFIYGVDVSHNRSKGIIAQIRDNGKAKFAILRACVGSSSEDEHLSQYIADRGDMKIGFFPASYFNSLTDASAEAKYFVDIIEKYGFTPDTVDLPLFCDWEGFSYEYNKKNGIEVTPAQLREFTKVFCEYVKQRGYKAGVYLNKDYWDNWYGQAFFDEHPDYYIWYARPGLDAPDRDCYLWQYACNEGSEYGVNEPLDKNILFGEYTSNKDNACATDCKCVEEIALLNSTISQLNKELQDAGSRIINLEQLNLILLDDKSNVVNQNQILEQEIEKFKIEIAELKNQLESQTAENTELKYKYSQLEQENEELKKAEEKCKLECNKKSFINILLDALFAWAKGV